MYLRPVHTDLDPQICHNFVKAHPLGLLITHLPSADASGAPLQASHIPFVIDAPPNGFAAEGGETAGSLGVLRGHIARANPQVKAILSATATAPASTTGGLISSIFGSSTSNSPPPPLDTLSDDVLVIFTSPTHSYVTPTFYTTTKPSTHKVVPTWDYAAVQVYGTLRVYNKGEETGAFLQRQVEDLTRMEEDKMQAVCPAGSLKRWDVDESPKSYVEALKKGIVGVEIVIKRIEGKFKMSQENELGDWEGVVDGFKGLGTEDGKRMAEAVEARGKDRVRRGKGDEVIGGEEVVKRGDGADHELSSASAEQAKADGV
ncbi:putative FMN-binding domain-containing protein [Dioszegia hungarica]|uniref:FMN-binding domain-containing protein n=1 Tax=Dioszegia hungarica TaxID=4972 RepID=A0AA38LX95_9TREE|nr:putative FMN-binding domain-containing protein [Dioszegia hungarica]KAI9638248.1 putative FMN-binding domain-containing protein [Dioszegia hungarica]